MTRGRHRSEKHGQVLGGFAHMHKDGDEGWVGVVSRAETSPICSSMHQRLREFLCCKLGFCVQDPCIHS